MINVATRNGKHCLCLVRVKTARRANQLLHPGRRALGRVHRHGLTTAVSQPRLPISTSNVIAKDSEPTKRRRGYLVLHHTAGVRERHTADAAGLVTCRLTGTNATLFSQWSGMECLRRSSRSLSQGLFGPHYPELSNGSCRDYFDSKGRSAMPTPLTTCTESRQKQG